MPLLNCLNVSIPKTLNAHIASDVIHSSKILNRLAHKYFMSVFGKLSRVNRPFLPFRIKISILSTKILRNASTVSTIVPFKAYLKRRGIQRSISDCVAAVNNRFLTSSEKWFKYRLLTGSLEVADKFFKDDRKNCFFCKTHPETTDHLLWNCPALAKTYQALQISLENLFKTKTSEEDFLTFTKNAKCDAVITKVQYILYKMQTVKNDDLSCIIPIASLYSKKLLEI
eukprot:TRINITY_DN3624_c0_g1_i2.p1 TRINITY_DN3624_c0_g1~~TRINITY_DN3624_c0_g1_i2.p1  ORF type:complete len:227 (+),score=-11.98 TRINITY_DN3624_c0_g1_i2:65-745(+)